MTDIRHYLDGKALYGDDFGPSQIAEWYRNEAEGYADLGAKNSESYSYGYHGWNRMFGYRYLPGKKFPRVLGFGSAYGDELLPIIDRIGTITVVDPSSSFVKESIGGKPAKYIKPSPDGRLPEADESFDLITCFGVLHHIPNVSFVFGELSRTLGIDGYLLLREPIISMGDWRRPRRGLTQRERGIPLSFLRSLAASNGLRVVKETLCGFPLTTRLVGWRNDAFNSDGIARFDAAISAGFAWNKNYHPKNRLEKLRPTSVFHVLQKTRE